MTNAELIAALKDAEGYIRYVAPSCIASDEAKEAIRDAADALEAAEKRIAIVEEERDLERFAAKNYLDKIDELKAQMSKEGEWLRTDAFPHRIYCSVCYKTYVPNDRWQIWVDDELPKNYCPYCGAKMRGEQE